MEEQKNIRNTTFQLPVSLLTELRMMCLLTEKSQGEFIRISIRDKIAELKKSKK